MNEREARIRADFERAVAGMRVEEFASFAMAVCTSLTQQMLVASLDVEEEVDLTQATADLLVLVELLKAHVPALELGELVEDRMVEFVKECGSGVVSDTSVN